MLHCAAVKIAIVPGDGIGVDVTKEAVKVLEAVERRRPFSFEPVHFPWSADHYLKTGETVPAGAFEDFSRNYAAIFMGAFGDPRVPDMKHAADILLGARFQLDLYVNDRPVRCLDDRLCPLKGCSAADVDFVIFRENTEGSTSARAATSRRERPTRSPCRRTSRRAKGSSASLRDALRFAAQTRQERVVTSDNRTRSAPGGDSAADVQEVARETRASRRSISSSTRSAGRRRKTPASSK